MTADPRLEAVTAALLAFGAGAIVGLGATTIGVYRVISRPITRLTDVSLLFVGGILLLAGIASCIGVIVVNSILATQ